MDIEPTWISDPEAVRELAQMIGAVSVCLSSAELLAGRKYLAADGLLSWPVARLRLRWLAGGLLARMLTSVFSYPQVLALVIARFVAAVSILLLHPGYLMAAVLTGVVAATSAAMLLRSPFGNDGADQMTLVCFVALSVSYIGDSQAVLNACLWFIAGQSCLSYFTSGVAKLGAPGWRHGEFVPFIFGTFVYGHSVAARLFQKSRRLSLFASWLVIIPECLFVLIFFIPLPWSMAFLAWGVMFHLLSASLMGLNTFFWSFVGTYPAVLYCSQVSSSLLLPNL